MTMILIQRIPLWNIFDLDFLRFSLQLKNVKESHEFLIKLAVGDVKYFSREIDKNTTRYFRQGWSF